MQIEHKPVGEGILLAAKIVLNLDHNEYDDFALGEGNSILWQQDAAEQLKLHLHKNGDEARRYKNGFDDKNIHFSHNAICIHGGRGTGKTVFLKNIESVWLQYTQGKQQLPKLHFLSSIDPTMLHEHDSFASVIIAQLYNAVESELSSRIDESQKDRFYQALRDLANAHGKSSEYEDATGIDRILNYRSGVKVQEYFHRFVLECTHILNCDGVVLRIDDVDMSLDRAFEVLDDVRKFLSCPFIIPVVSGDLALYSRIMENHFAERLDGEHVKPKQDEESTDADHSLAEAYLTKVFPNHLRINLLPMEILQSNLTITWLNGANKEHIAFADYLIRLNRLFFPLCNGREKSHQWVLPVNARETAQVVSAVLPDYVSNQNNEQANSEHLPWLMSWSQSKQDGANYLNVFSYLRAPDEVKLSGLSKLPLFNLHAQAAMSKRLGWGYKNAMAEQKKALKRLGDTSVGQEYWLESGFRQDDKVQRAMPPLEFITNELQIRKSQIKDMPPSLLLKIYSQETYYQKGTATRPIVFFSRAFEILLCSVLKVTGNAPDINWHSLIQEIFNRLPFYSVPNLAPSKVVEIDEDGEEESALDEAETPENDDEEEAPVDEGEKPKNDDEAPSPEKQNTAFSKQLSKQIQRWEDEHAKDLQSQFKGVNLFPLFSSVFNRVFTQLHLYRQLFSEKKAQYQGETLGSAIKRFEIITVNSFIYFMKHGELSAENSGIAAKPDTILDWDTFFNSSGTLKLNMSGFLDRDIEIVDTEPQGVVRGNKGIQVFNRREEKALVRAIWDHPVFFIPEHSSKATKELLPRFIKLGMGDSVESAETKTVRVRKRRSFESPSKFASARALLNYLSDPKTINRKGKRITRQDVKDWAVLFPNVAREFSDRLMMLLDKDLEELIRLEENPTTNTGIVYKVLLKHFGNK